MNTEPNSQKNMASRPRPMLILFSGILVSLLLLLLPIFFPPLGKIGPDFLAGLGRFHLLALHLPIALLLLVPLAEFFKPLRPAAFSLLTLAAASAIGASILGIMLASNDGFEGQLVVKHMWGGIVTTILCNFAWVLKALNDRQKGLRLIYGITLFCAMASLMWGSHQGASLVHGEHYLTEKFSFSAKPPPSLTTPAFEGLIQPIFTVHCYGCHSADKTKGGLRMDDLDLLFEGGDGGMPGIEPGSLEDSEVYYRITLPASKKAFMPPAGHLPLTQNQIHLISWWINAGAPTQTTIGELLKTHPNEQVKNLIQIRSEQ